MRSNVTGLLGRATRTFATFTSAQKVISILAVLGLLLGGYAFTAWASKPSYAPLFTDLAPADASAIVDQLNSAGTPYQLTNGGATILVPQAQVYDTRIAMSGKGLAPSAGSAGWGLLDKQGVTTSKFQQQVAYRRALEGELAATVGGIEGVSTAVVHLALPEKGVFTKETEDAKASVLVATTPGRDLTSAQVQAIVNLVSSAVEGMSPDGVTVADSSGKVLSSSAKNNAGAAADSRAQQTRDYETRVASSLQAMIDRVVGPGHSEVRLTADLDFDQTKTTTEKFTDSGAKPTAGSTTTEKFTGTGAATGGVLGPDNIAVPGGTNGNGTYEKTTATENNALNRVVEERASAPGAVRKLNVAVLLDAKTSGTANPEQIQALVASAVGLDAKRGDTVVVDSLPFDETAAASAAKELEAAKKADAAAERNELIFAAAKYLGIALLLLVLVLFARKRLARAARNEADRREIEALQAALLAQADTRELAAVTGVDRSGTALGELAPSAAVAARSDVGDLVKSQPEEVAQLLRGWLADRRTS
ncbi:MAG: flagellar basal-body MS-ring/collar protein FliF [Sporichthyaceae bacterium]